MMSNFAKDTNVHTNDCISRQALMKEFADFVKRSNNSDFADTPTWNDAVSLVGSMPSAQPKWIPVTERLPDDGEDVLITFCGEEETRIVPVNYYQKIWFDCIFDIELNPHMVTAWMPLPEPWKGEDE